MTYVNEIGLAFLQENMISNLKVFLLLHTQLLRES